MLGNIALLFLIAFLAIILLIGTTLIIIGLTRKNKKNNIIKVGLVYCSIPVAIGLIVLLWDVTLARPGINKLTGVYHIIRVDNLQFDKSTFKNYTLKLYADSSFSLSQTPYIQICDSGKFWIEGDYQFMHNNKIWFNCPSGPNRGYFGISQVDGHIGSFTIEFIHGDPDSEESIFFAKTNK